MSVVIELAEQRALVKMLMHEHFSYGEEGLLAASALKKISAAAEAGQELTFVGGEEDALKDIKAMKDDAHRRATVLSNVANLDGAGMVAAREEIERAMMAAYSRGRASQQEAQGAALTLLKRLREIGCPTYICRDGSRTRDGALLCTFCDEPVGEERRPPHADECLWLSVQRIADGA